MSAAHARPIPDAFNVGSSLVGDGSRYVAFSRAGGTPVVLDAKRRKVRPVQGAKDCSPVDINAGRVLLDCSDQFEAFRPARLASVNGGRSYRVRGSSVHNDLTEVGRYWLRGHAVCPAACSSVVYISRRDGRRRSFSSGDPITNRHPLLSYDDLDLDRKKLRFRPHPCFVPSINSRVILDFRRSFYLVDDGSLRIWWSVRSSTRIGRSIGADSLNNRGLSIGSGRVVWVKKRHLYVFELRSRRGPNLRLSSRGAKAVPVRQGVVVAVPTGGDDVPTRYRVRIVHIG